MESINIALLIIWAFLFIYAIAGSIDFGAGFWAMYYQNQTDTESASIANRYLSPSWEVTNVFLVLLVVAFVGFFPGGAANLGTLMIVPFCLVLILLTIRSAFMVYSHSVKRYTRLFTIFSGLTGLLIPALLITILPAAIGGYVINDGVNQYILVDKLFSSSTFYTHIGFGLATELFLSSLLLSDYAREANSMETYHTYRRNAMTLGPITLAFAVAAIYTLIPHAPWMFDNITDSFRLILLGLSFLAFVIGYSALWWPAKTRRKIGQPRYAVIFIIIQFGLASFAYSSAQLPYLLYPDITVQDAFTNETMFRLLLFGYAGGMAVLIPVFIWFWRLFMKDKRYLLK
ncbi:cytochrome d ubiquinol oxidase subunit II [Alkalicoccobacillus gibsonii]|uniref:cytochrome d ubiquinol oxidase subunit II n=1 Tax=Alkalicoccobacillus gibsonii TaxID=79881 RepID=UPI003F7BF99C